MFRLPRAQTLPIGCDIGHDAVKLLQLDVAGGGLSVVASARSVLPEAVRRNGDAWRRLAASAELVRAALRGAGGGFVGRHVAACLPRELIAIKNIRLPVMPVAELAGAVEFEAANAFPNFDAQQTVVQFLPGGEVRQGTETRQEVIVFAARRDDIDRFTELLHGTAGVIVDSIDPEPCALYRGLEKFIRRREDEMDVHVLIDIGLTRSTVVIGRGREISFMKAIDLGGRQLDAAVAKHLSLTTDEARALRRRIGSQPSPAATSEGDAAPIDPVRQAVFDATRDALGELSREISLCLRYYTVTFRGSRPARAKLTGGEGGDALVLAALNAALPMPVEPARPLLSVNTTKMRAADRHGSNGEWSVAFGLALRPTAGKFAPRDGRPRDPNATAETPPIAPVAATAAIETSAAAASAPASALLVEPELTHA